MNKRYPHLLKRWLLMFILPAGTLLPAQDGAECLNFDDLIPGSVYGERTAYAPGDRFPGPEAGPLIRLQPFHYISGETDFRNVFVYEKTDLNWDIGSGQVIFPSNINLEIDFSVLPYPVQEVCFEFFDGGGEENIAVNGQPVKVLGNFLELLTNNVEIAPGVTLSIERNGNADFPGGRFCLRGPIKTLLIGGQELAIDNICYGPAPAEGCRIGNVGVEVEPCTPNGIFYATLKFEVTAPGSEGYTVRGNGREYGRFRYADPFPRLGPFPADGQTVYELVVIDNENPECNNYVEFGPIRCAGDCRLAQNLRTRIAACHEDGSYDLLVDLDILAAGDDLSLEVNVEGQSYGTFAAGDFPLALSRVQVLTDALTFNVEVCLETGPTDATGDPVRCCLSNTVEKKCPPDCTLGGMEVFNIECRNDGTYNATLNFRHNNSPEAYFILKTEGGFTGRFQYRQLPLRLTGLPRPGADDPNALRDVFQVCAVSSNANDECCARTAVELPCPPAGCALGELLIRPTPCDENGEFFVYLNFDHRGGSGVYVLSMNGNDVAVIRAADLPLKLSDPAFTGPLSEPIRFRVRDREFESCVTEGRLAPFDCAPACRLGEIQVTDIECLDNGTYNATINFRHQNAGERFVLHTAGGFRGEFLFGELPLRLTGLPLLPGGNKDVFEICSLNNPGCCTRAEVSCGGSQDCSFANLRVQPTECENGQFFIGLAFTPVNPGERGYYVFADGDIFGPFSYSDNQIRLGPFAGDGATVYDLLLLDAANPACYAYAEVGPVDCERTCRIGELDVEITGCNPDGTYRVRINFRYQNPGNDFFDLYLFEQHLGYYPLADLPLTLNLAIPPDDNTYPDDDRHAVFRVCINDHPDCCTRVAVERRECGGSDHEVWPGDANTDNIANHIDLLNLGLAYGSRGPGRQEQTTDWEGINAVEWPQYFADGTNFKHADTNGDGVIDDADIEAIRANYGRTHGTPEDFEPLPTTDLDPPIFIDWPDLDALPPGTEVEVPIILGTAGTPVRDIYGLAFTLRFDTRLVAAENVGIIFPTSWFGQPGVNVITIDRLFAGDGLVEIALSRTDQNEVSGYGPIAYFKGIIDDIAGIQQSFEFGIMRSLAIDKGQHVLPLAGRTTVIELPAGPEPGVTRDLLQRSLRLYPNPAGASVHIRNAFNLPIDWVEVFDSTGRLAGSRQTAANEVMLTSLPAGVYVLRIKIGPYILYERVVRE